MTRARRPASHAIARPLLPLCLALAACGGGGGGGGTPTAPTPPSAQNLVVTGTTRAVSATGCASDNHAFLAADGEISVTLQQTTGGIALATQVCAGNDDNNCSINTTRIAVGETVRGTRRGGEQQNMKFLTLNCGGNEPPPPTPIEYRATIQYLH